MTQLTNEIKKAISKQISKKDAFPVATSDQDQTPNVAYITHLKVINDQTVLIADNYLNKTRNNILSNGKIAFAVLPKYTVAYA